MIKDIIIRIRKNAFGTRTMFTIMVCKGRSGEVTPEKHTEVRGRENAEKVVETLMRHRMPEQKEAGWSYYLK